MDSMKINFAITWVTIGFQKSVRHQLLAIFPKLHGAEHLVSLGWKLAGKSAAYQILPWNSEDTEES
jgi:hypothetical protein